MVTWRLQFSRFRFFYGDAHTFATYANVFENMRAFLITIESSKTLFAQHFKIHDIIGKYFSFNFEIRHELSKSQCSI